MSRGGITGEGRRKGLRLAALVTVLTALVVVAVASASNPARTVSIDWYTNTSSQHRTQLEPAAYGNGSRIVASFQSGRFFNGGASNVGVAVSGDGGRYWAKKWPSFTISEGGIYDRATDPGVTYDARHNVWIVVALGLDGSGRGAGVVVSRSTNGGNSWQAPVTVALSPSTFFDKTWVACDSWPASPHYGNCYVEWDDNGLGNLLMMSTSTDGGLTWSSPAIPSGNPSGLGGVPVAQPNGNVVVPYTANYSAVRAFRSTDGGATWSSAVLVGTQNLHSPAGGVRSLPMPSADVDASGKVFVIWYDCRFRSGCASNDIVMSTSTDGTTWSAAERIPIDPTTSTVDHFLHGLAIDHATQGATAKMGVGYYYYPVANCTTSTCELDFGFISSSDGGASWSAPVQVAGPMNLSWLPQTSQGRMVGDYVGVAFAGGAAHPVFAAANAPNGSVFDEWTASAGYDIAAMTRNGTVKLRRDRVRVQPSRKAALRLLRQGRMPAFPRAN